MLDGIQTHGGSGLYGLIESLVNTAGFWKISRTSAERVAIQWPPPLAFHSIGARSRSPSSSLRQVPTGCSCE